jgi:hypothetical protein
MRNCSSRARCSGDAPRRHGRDTARSRPATARRCGVHETSPACRLGNIVGLLDPAGDEPREAANTLRHNTPVNCALMPQDDGNHVVERSRDDRRQDLPPGAVLGRPLFFNRARRIQSRGNKQGGRASTSSEANCI